MRGGQAAGHGGGLLAASGGSRCVWGGGRGMHACRPWVQLCVCGGGEGLARYADPVGTLLRRLVGA